MSSDPQKETAGASLYIHIPFCRALCTYCGCNTRITRNQGMVAPYIAAIHQELATYLQALGQSRLVVSELHLGGGTPTFLTASELAQLMEGVLAQVELRDAELSLEADPRVTDAEQLRVLYQFGFRRLSLGVQDFDEKVQEIVHRVQSEAEVAALTESARSIGYHSINYDLIYGLPKQTLQSIETTLKAVQRLRPDRIAFYSYAHVPWIKASQRRFTEADLPQADEKRKLYELGRSQLEAVGYHEIGMDHFALEGDALWTAVKEKTLHRNFMGYTSKFVAPQIGLGVSAIGDAWGAFAQNEKNLEKYQARVAQGEIPIFRGHLLTPQDQVLRTHILHLMTRLETHWEDPSLQDEFLSDLSGRLAEMVQDQLVQLTPHSLVIAPEGRPFLRNICMAFDARLWEQKPSTSLFSQTI